MRIPVLKTLFNFIAYEILHDCMLKMTCRYYNTEFRFKIKHMTPDYSL